MEQTHTSAGYGVEGAVAHPVTEASPQDEREREVARLEAELRAIDRQIASARAGLERYTTALHAMPTVLENRASTGIITQTNDEITQMYAEEDGYISRQFGAIRAVRLTLTTRLTMKALIQGDLNRLRQELSGSTSPVES